MPKAGTTDVEHDEAVAEVRAWEEFHARLVALRSLREAHALLGRTPPPNAAGRKFYSHLAIFLLTLKTPATVNDAERALYLHLLLRLEASGTASPRAAAALRSAIGHIAGD